MAQDTALLPEPWMVSSDLLDPGEHHSAENLQINVRVQPQVTLIDVWGCLMFPGPGPGRILHILKETDHVGCLGMFELVEQLDRHLSLVASVMIGIALLFVLLLFVTKSIIPAHLFSCLLNLTEQRLSYLVSRVSYLVQMKS